MLNNLISLLSVLTTAAVSVWSIWNSAHKDLEIHNAQLAHEAELVKLNHEFDLKDRLEKQQFDIYMDIIPLLLELHEGDRANEQKLLRLALSLYAATIPGTPQRQAADHILQAINHHSDQTDWLYVAKDSAGMMHYYADASPLNFETHHS